MADIVVQDGYVGLVSVSGFGRLPPVRKRVPVFCKKPLAVAVEAAFKPASMFVGDSLERALRCRNAPPRS